MNAMKDGLIEKAPVGQKTVVKESKKGQRPMAKNESVSTDRGKFTIK